MLGADTVRYTPGAAASGVDVFRYDATDGQATSAEASVTVRLIATAPVLSLLEPVDGTSTSDVTPRLRGVAGLAGGDEPAVRVRIFAGAGLSGALLQTKTASRDATSAPTHSMPTRCPTGRTPRGPSSQMPRGTPATAPRARSGSRPLHATSLWPIGKPSAVPVASSASTSPPGRARPSRVTRARRGRPSSSIRRVSRSRPTGTSSSLIQRVGGSGGVIRVNPSTGARTTVSRNSSPKGSTKSSIRRASRSRPTVTS